MNNPIIEKAINRVGTQQKLAELTGLSQAAIHKLLTKKTVNPSKNTIIALSRATGIPTNDFFND